MTMHPLHRNLLAGIALMLATASAAAAQPPPPQGQQPSGAMQGLTLNRDQPVKIESVSLEVRDKSRQATFSGEVKLTQGETTLKCNTLVVFYEDSAAPGPKKGKPQKQDPKQDPKAAAAPGGQQIKRVEAKGNVFVTQKDQTATGDNGIYDLKTNSIELTGNVVVTQGQNVMRGERMVVDMTTGITRVESSKSGGRVELLALPSSVKDTKSGPAPAPPPSPPKASPGAPTRLN